MTDLSLADLHVWTRADALAQGLDDRSISALVRSGEWVRLRHGTYTSGEVWRSLDDMGRHAVMARAVLARAGTDVVVSHVSALPEFEAPSWGLPLEVVHVNRLDGRAGRVQAGVHQHRGVLGRDDVVVRHGVHVTSATKTALDLTATLPAEAALVQLNHLLGRGETTLPQLWERYESMQRAPRTLRTRLLLGLARPRIESVLESRGFYFFWRHDLPEPVVQHEVLDEHGQVVARLDLALPQHGAWFELDGRAKYELGRRPGEPAGEVVWREKLREDMIRQITGWRCFRITWADLADPVRLRRQIARFLDLPEPRREFVVPGAARATWVS